MFYLRSCLKFDMKNFLRNCSQFKIAIIIYVVLGFGIYFQCLHYGYALDDAIVCSENQFVKKGFGGIREIFSEESFTGYFGKQNNLVAGARYRPLSIASFAVEVELFGFKPGVSHLINIVLYILCSILIYSFTKKLLSQKFTLEQSQGIAFLSSLLFLVHPIHVEAVANIKGRDEIMCLLFGLLAGIYWMKDIDQSSLKNKMIGAVWFFLSIMSKENAITLWVAFPVLFYFFRNNSWKQSINSSWPYILAGAIFIVVRISAVGFLFDKNLKIDDLMNDPFVEMNLIQKLCTICFTILWYLKLLLVPHPLTHDYYPYHVPKLGPDSAWFWVSFFVLAAMTLFSFVKQKLYPYFTATFWYFAATISIVSNVVFPVGTFMNERFLFMPSLAFCVWIGYLFYQYLSSDQKNSRTIAYSALSVVLGLFSLRSFTRVPVWESGDTLNFSAIHVSKNSARINLFTGVSYFHKYEAEQNQQQKYENLTLAQKYISKALNIYPNYDQAHNMFIGVMAEWHKKDGDTKKFLENIKLNAEKKPSLNFLNEYLNYIKTNSGNDQLLYDFYKQVGFDGLYKRKRNYQYALQYLGEAYKINKADQDLLLKLSQVYTDYALYGKLDPSTAQEYKNYAEQFKAQALQIQ